MYLQAKIFYALPCTQSWNINLRFKAALKNLGGSGCTSSKPCQPCQGDCDSDADCAGASTCLQRNALEAVQGCSSGGSGDKSGYDYCVEAAMCLCSPRLKFSGCASHRRPGSSIGLPFCCCSVHGITSNVPCLVDREFLEIPKGS